ncbi:SDR family oxidoreductase [Streptomyces sp. NBC_00988]|uniref:SDR family NAD(P)-dependent oxidoreductase n=1 Tax=Streptomyces sp. NBC_00988 TaxID=2903704 RepID=UPI00386A3CC7|nr:SDR family oxidoreductase [Streptomyces sp. NBC_00988]
MITRPGRLAGKVVLISGTGGGQGRAAARVFAGEEAIVVGCDIDPLTAQETVEIVRRDGFEMYSTVVDLTDQEQLRGWIDGAVADHGRIDVLYNNAGRHRNGAFPDLSEEDLDFTLRNELHLVWNASQAAWPHFASRPGGAIVNIASTSALIGSRVYKSAAHHAANGAIVSLTRALAGEGAEIGLRVNSISPGVISSPPVQRMLDRDGDDAMFMPFVRATAFQKLGAPEDIAYAALYLASDEARYVNGANLVVDCGTTVLVN